MAAVRRLIPDKEFDIFYSGVELKMAKFLPQLYTMQIGLRALNTIQLIGRDLFV